MCGLDACIENRSAVMADEAWRRQQLSQRSRRSNGVCNHATAAAGFDELHRETPLTEHAHPRHAKRARRTPTGDPARRSQGRALPAAVGGQARAVGPALWRRRSADRRRRAPTCRASGWLDAETADAGVRRRTPRAQLGASKAGSRLLSALHAQGRSVWDCRAARLTGPGSPSRTAGPRCGRSRGAVKSLCRVEESRIRRPTSARWSDTVELRRDRVSSWFVSRRRRSCEIWPMSSVPREVGHRRA